MINSFRGLKHVHILGVCGTLMGSFAAFLRRAGVRVTGSDQNVYPPMSDVLADARVELFSPYSEENLSKLDGIPDLVVVGNVISRTNVEMQAWMSSKIPYVSLPEFMEQHLLPGTRNLVVAGTHGKTTTSSLLAHVLSVSKRKPSYFIGGVSKDLPNSFHVDSGDCFILEGDEYDTAFWDKVPKFSHYLPNDVILTSIEYDHADIYPSLDSINSVFTKMLEKIRSGGRLIVCVDEENVRSVLRSSKISVPVLRYSKKESVDSDVWIESISVEKGVSNVTFQRRGAGKGGFQINLTGEHNALNALAVYLECELLGLSHEQIHQGLSSFVGVKRRQEERGEIKGVLVIDDFAHHPTAVRETLLAFRMKYPGRKLLTVFEPRSATSRRKVFQKEYSKAFDLSDEVFIAEAFDKGKLPEGEAFSSKDLVQDLHAIGKKALFFKEVEEGVKLVAQSAKSGDVVAILSNGGFGGFIPKLLEALKAQ